MCVCVCVCGAALLLLLLLLLLLFARPYYLPTLMATMKCVRFSRARYTAPDTLLWLPFVCIPISQSINQPSAAAGARRASHANGGWL